MADINEITGLPSTSGFEHVHFVFNDEGDWAGIYHKGVLVYEGHSIPDDKYIEIIGRFAECQQKPYHNRITTQHGVDISDDGRFPENIYELPGWTTTPKGWQSGYIREDDSRLS